LKNNRETNEHLKSKADEIIAAMPVELQFTLGQWKAARKLRAETGCHLSTAKRHVRDAIARATGNEPQREWGGARKGGGFTAEKRAELAANNEPG
jgi:hypothetical protein